MTDSCGSADYRRPYHHRTAGPSAITEPITMKAAVQPPSLSAPPAASMARPTPVGVLIEVPVTLSVVKIVNATKPWFEAGKAVKANATS